MIVRRLNIGRLVRPHWKVLGIAFVAILIESASGLMEPWPLKVIFDHVIGSKPTPTWLASLPFVGDNRLALLNAAACAVIAIAIAGAISSYAEKYLSTTVGQRVMHDLRHTLYHHVQRLSLSFFEHRQTGDMVVRLTSDIDAVQDFISSVFLRMMMDSLTLLGMLAVMLYLDLRFTAIAFVTAPIMLLVVYRLTRRIKKAARDVKRQESELASVVQESIASIKVVQAFGREAFEEARLDKESEESVNAVLRARSIKARLTPFVDIIVAVGTCVVLLFGARLVLQGELSSGALLVFVLYLGKMYKPMKDLSKTADTVSKAVVSFERIGELLDTESQVRDLPGARLAPRFAGRIEFAHVTFGYRPDRLVLKDVNLVIEPGEAVALVGPTGGGKSTLLGLIPRFYDVFDGHVRIDGRDVRAYTLMSLRDQISLVLQDSVLFHTTIWQNIAYGNPAATRDDIVRAAKLANAHEFIHSMPQGYESVVGERGDTLSGGQRQRIAIARAIIRNTPILLLDEPSAALDPESEELVFDALARLMHGKTSLTVAHRLTTARRADRIVVLDDGRIVESGRHEHLMAVGGLYSRLYEKQFAHRTQTLRTSDPRDTMAG
jgi:subfamily B ATP-binding cassette protein MsbA